VQQITCISTGFTLVTALAFSATTMAADLPKEGTFSGTMSGAATVLQTNTVGKEQLLMLWDENCFTVGKGFLDHATWHCLGTLNIKTGIGQFSGYCVVTDPTGDQIAADIASDGPYPADAKTISAKGTFTTGTGKYAGITGSLTNILHDPEFRTAQAGIIVVYGDFQVNYKLP
jgi:hypothetical protein